jgi:hypothetical protein
MRNTGRSFREAEAASIIIPFAFDVLQLDEGGRR